MGPRADGAGLVGLAGLEGGFVAPCVSLCVIGATAGGRVRREGQAGLKDVVEPPCREPQRRLLMKALISIARAAKSRPSVPPSAPMFGRRTRLCSRRSSSFRAR